MTLLNFIVDFAGLFLWLNWLSIRPGLIAKSPASSLLTTLRKTDSPVSGRWKYLAGLLGLLVLRALLYDQIGANSGWAPKLELEFVTLSFRSDFHDYLARMLLFSLLSFAWTLVVFYLWLALLSVVNRSVPDTDTVQRLVRLHLSWVERWPRVLKLLLPFLAGGIFWLASHPVLSRLAIVPASGSGTQLLKQAAVMGVGTYLCWSWLIAGALVLHLLNTYVYLGSNPIWNFANVTARNLLTPLRWLPLRFGKVDFLPLFALVLVLGLSHLLSHPSEWKEQYRRWFYQHLPL